ncbi:MAG: helix-turn-helix domain-containing protein [Clostridia bacterium]|nr:helix-turn-helix domain-containing protein [Clostridia bacterium]
MTIGEIIYNRRKELGLTLEEIGNATGVSKSTVKKWENGFIANMRRDKIEKLAKILQISPIVLLGNKNDNDKPNAEIVSAGENIYKIPVFSSVSAGFGAYACSDVIDYLHLYIANPADAPEMLCIKVTGDSMYPKIEDGDIIVVRKQDSVDSGSIAVVLVDNEEGFVKKVIYDNEIIELHSINPEYAPKIFKGAEVLRVRVVGIVKQVIKTL